MKGLIVNVVVGVGLFAGALVGGLMATGRWNHEGTANIPVLNSLFPEPPKAEGDEDVDGHGAAPASESHASGAHGSPAEASGAHGQAIDASHGQDPQDPPLQPLKRGKSVKQTEEPKGGGGHGGGHGEEPAGHGEESKGAHGDAAKDGHGQKAAHGADPHAAPGHGESSHGSLPEKDFAQLTSGSRDPDQRYKPGAYFKFDGMPAGVTPDQLNDAWKRVQEGVAELERRSKALDLREQELREFSDDIARRQTEVGKERAQVESLQRQLDERIAQFQDQVKMIKTDEVALLQKNAKTYANMPASKVAELVRDYWKTESGQVQMLKTFEFMTNDAYDQILAALPNDMVREILDRRGRIGRETMPSGAPRK